MTLDLTLALVWLSILAAYWLGKRAGRRERMSCQGWEPSEN